MPDDANDDHQLLTGHQPVLLALRARRRPLYHLYLSRDLDAAEFVRAAGEAGVPVTRLTSRELGDRVESGKHQGAALECGALPEFAFDELLRFSPPDGRDLLVLLDGVEDPRNLGAVARSASFFGARALVVPARSSAPLSPSASRTSAGALETLPVARVSRIAEACRRLRDEAWEVAGIELGGEPLASWDGPADKVALVMGGEDRGISHPVKRHCSRLFTIPGSPGGAPTGSLNVSVAAGIALFHLTSRLFPKTP
jgi:23S rRNA (guanosine2251-2'-O)-methyltransferase